MKHIYAAIFSVFSIIAFADISHAQPSPVGTAHYVFDNADRFDGKSVTIYVRSATKIRPERDIRYSDPFRKKEKFKLVSNNPFDKLSDEEIAEIEKDYIPFKAITVDSYGNTKGTIVILVKKKKAKYFAEKYKARMTRKQNGSTVEQQRIGLNGKFDKALGMIIMR